MDETIRKADALRIIDMMLESRRNDLNRAKQHVDMQTVGSLEWLLAKSDRRAYENSVDVLELARRWIDELESIK